MNTSEHTDFKMSMDDEHTDSEIHSQREDSRIEKLNNKITFISILIPCFIVIVIIFVYMDITKRVIKAQDTGTIKVENLSQDLESRLSSIVNNNKALNESTDKRFSDLDKKTQKQIKSLKAAKSKVNKSLSKIDSEMASLRTDLKDTTTEIKKLSVTVDKSTDTLKKSQEDIQNLSASATKNRDLYTALETIHKKAVNRLDQKTSELENTLLTIQKKIIILEKVLKLSRVLEKAVPNENISQNTSKEEKATIQQDDTTTKNIIEQDIVE
jgi:methyl-accepting chemotaxis protein